MGIKTVISIDARTVDAIVLKQIATQFNINTTRSPFFPKPRTTMTIDWDDNHNATITIAEPMEEKSDVEFSPFSIDSNDEESDET